MLLLGKVIVTKQNILSVSLLERGRGIRTPLLLANFLGGHRRGVLLEEVDKIGECLSF